MKCSRPCASTFSKPLWSSSMHDWPFLLLYPYCLTWDDIHALLLDTIFCRGTSAYIFLRHSWHLWGWCPVLVFCQWSALAQKDLRQVLAVLCGWMMLLVHRNAGKDKKVTKEVFEITLRVDSYVPHLMLC